MRRRFLLIVALLATSARLSYAESGGECSITETGEEICDESNDDDDYFDSEDYEYDEYDSEDDEYEDEEGVDEESYECADEDKDCGFWAEEGECEANPRYMHSHCPVSCNTCHDIEDEDLDDVSDTIDPNEKRRLLKLIIKYGEKQTVEGDESSATLFVIKEALVYMKNFVHAKNPTHRMSAQTIAKCRNRDENCAFWAATGECKVNPSYMATTCAPSCKSCHLIDLSARCPIDPTIEPSLKPGDLNKMFDRIVKEAADGSKGYTVTVHSRPSAESMLDPVIDEKKDLEQPPWVVTLDNFLSDEECEHLIQMGYKAEYKRSEDVGKELFDGTFDSTVSQGRTSENAWCSEHSGCRNDTIVTQVYDKMSKLIGMPPHNSEDLQILKYEAGQFYHVHHDYIENQRDRQCGPRILTFFLYLSDVDSGGGTRFPLFDPPITIQPKLGRALLWPSVLNSKPRDKEDRTDHEALPVEKGTKFAANAWIHLFNNQKAEEMGCT